MDKYKEMLRVAQNDHKTLLHERADLVEQQELVSDQLEETQGQINKLEETILSLSRLCGIDPSTVRPTLSNAPLARARFKDVVGNVVKRAVAPMTAVEVRSRMLEDGFDDSKYNNLLANVHVTLKRLAESGELLTEQIDGKTAYKINPEYFARIERIGIQHPTTMPPGRVNRAK